MSTILVLLQVHEFSTKLWVCELLANLASDRKFVLYIFNFFVANHCINLAELGSIEHLISILENKHVKASGFALQILYNMAVTGLNARLWIGECPNGIPFFCEILKNPKVTQLRDLALGIICKITEEVGTIDKKEVLGHNKKLFVDSGGIPALIKIVKDEKDEKIRKDSVKIFKNVSNSGKIYKIDFYMNFRKCT